MESFKGNLENFKKIVESRGLFGKWEIKGNLTQFKDEEGGIINWYPTTGKILYQGPKEKQAEIIRMMARPALVDTEKCGTKINKRIFVVHGHDSTSREQLELIIHKLGLDPFVLANNGGDGLTIIEALEKHINSNKDGCSFGIVLLTPDDFGYSKIDGQDNIQPRARQNVVLEMGMLMSAIGRGNVAILKKGHIETPSDAQGIIYIPYNDHVKETVPKLVSRLSAVGFDITPDQIGNASS